MLCKTVQSLQVLKRYKVLLYHLPKFVTHKQTFKSLLITRTIFKPAVRLLVLLGTDIGLTKMVCIFLYFRVTWLPWGFDEVFDEFFWQFFWRISLTNFLMISLTKLLMNFLTNLLTIFFNAYLTNYLMIFRQIFCIIDWVTSFILSKFSSVPSVLEISI